MSLMNETEYAPWRVFDLGNEAIYKDRGLVMDTYMDTKAGFEINNDLAISLTSKDDEQNHINFLKLMTECMGLAIPWVYGAKGYAIRGFVCVRSCMTAPSGLTFANQRFATTGLGLKRSGSFCRKLIFEQINRYNVQDDCNGNFMANYCSISRVNPQSSVLGNLASIFARLMSIKILLSINQSINVHFGSFLVSLQFKKTLIFKCCKQYLERV